MDGIDEIICSAALAGFSCILGKQALFDLGMCVEDDPVVLRLFHANVDVVVRCGDTVDPFSIMHQTLSTLGPGDLILLRRRVERARPLPAKAPPHRNRFRPGLTFLDD
jgi:hypothetical protein